MTYFRTGNPYYHRRAAVSRSCSGWEGVVPAGYGRQALTVISMRKSVRLGAVSALREVHSNHALGGLTRNRVEVLRLRLLIWKVRVG